MATSHTIRSIVSALNADPASDLNLDLPIRRIATLADADDASVSWVDGQKWLDAAQTSQAAAIVVAADVGGGLPNRLVVPDVQTAVADLLDLFAGDAAAPEPGVHPSAVVEPGATVAASAHVGPLVVIRAGAAIGERSVIGAGASIGRGVVIGTDCRVYDHAVIYDRCTLGNRVILHANTVIGADGFGYIFREGQHRKLRHIGTVVIEDDVEIGAGSTVDRGKVGETRIGRGTKIDNQVQVAHNVTVGPLSILVAQVGLAGSVRLGAGCILGGQVGVAEGVFLADGTRVAAQSGVMNDFPDPNHTVMGSPAQEHTAHKRDVLRVRRLPQLTDRVVALEKKVTSLEGAKDH